MVFLLPLLILVQLCIQARYAVDLISTIASLGGLHHLQHAEGNRGSVRRHPPSVKPPCCTSIRYTTFQAHGICWCLPFQRYGTQGPENCPGKTLPQRLQCDCDGRNQPSPWSRLAPWFPRRPAHGGVHPEVGPGAAGPGGHHRPLRPLPHEDRRPGANRDERDRNNCFQSQRVPSKATGLQKKIGAI